MNGSTTIAAVGWIGLGEQGAPLARAIAEAGYTLHVWARRRPQSLEALGGVRCIAHESIAQLGAASDVVSICLEEDSEIREVLGSGGLWASLKPGSVISNHGTGLPQFAIELAARGAERGIGVLDAPVSRGHPGALARQLTTIVGGDKAVAERLTPVFKTFSQKVAYIGSAGSGQTAKLINDALLILNQEKGRTRSAWRAIIAALIDLLLSGTGSSFPLQALLGAVAPDNAGRLKVLQVIETETFKAAMDALGQGTAQIYARAMMAPTACPT
jgi:hypothetical protein